MVWAGTEWRLIILKNKFNEPRNNHVYVFISERIKSGNFEKSIYFKTESAKQKLERNSSGNDQLSKPDRSPIAGDLSGGGIGNGKDAKQLCKSRPRQLTKLRFLSGQ